MEEYIPAINSAEKEMTRLQLETLYRVMLKRIGKGYTAEELSFLCGRKPNFIDHAEKWFLHFYNNEDLQHIAAALQENSVKDIVADADNEERFKVKVKWYHDDEVDYMEYSYFNYKNREYPLFTLKEEISASHALSNQNLDGFHSLLQVIRTMIEADYFLEKRHPLEVYLAVKPLMAFAHFRPQILETVLSDFCTDKKEDGMLEVVDYDGYAYGFLALPVEE